MKLTGAQIVIETLVSQNVDTVFGYPGGSVLNIYDELYKNSDRIHHYITSHEQGAAHAADGYARATGKVGVVFATSGPGATNLVTGIATAYLDSTPLVAITGNVAVDLIGRDSFQEVDIVGITMPVTKHNYIVKDVKDLASTICEAFRIAKSGRPGPVLIDIPKDVQINACEYEPCTFQELEPFSIVKEEKLNTAVQMIEQSERPFIYAGGGVILSNAADELLDFAQKCAAPIGSSMMGLSAVPCSYKGALGMVGMHGQFAATKAMYEADLIIAVGVRFSDRVTGNKAKFAKSAKVLHIEIDPAEISKNILAHTFLVGDIENTLSALTKKIKQQEKPEWSKQIEQLKQEQAKHTVPCEGLNPKCIIEKVCSMANEDTLVVTDVGQHQMWTSQYYNFHKPRTFLTSGGLGTMGFGLGAAIGGCIGAGKQKTVLFTGDGSFHMNLNEMSTAVSNNLPLIIIIMNNGVLGMVRQWQSLFYDQRYSNTTLERKTDFAKLAEAFGAQGIRVSKYEEFEPALKKAFQTNSPIVIDCKIDRDEKVLPMIPPGGSIEDIMVK